jgi:hypothetical protein
LVQPFPILTAVQQALGGAVGETFRSKTAWWLLLLAVCTHFSLIYLQNSRPFLNLSEYVHGTAKLPYQYRVLMAWLMRGAWRIPHLEAITTHLPPPLRDRSIFILFATSWISLLGSVLFTQRSLFCLTGSQPYSRWASLLVVYMAYFQFPLAFGLNFLLPYDLPSLFFFCACLYCVISRRMFLFYLFFILGILNRETICMATLFLLLWHWKKGQRGKELTWLFAHVLAQAALWISIKLYLHRLFSGNLPEMGSSVFYYKLGYNLRTIVKAQQWPVLLSVFGFTLPLVLAGRRWMKNAAMERAIYLLPAWFVAMMLLGVIIEIRIFAELISYMALAVGLIAYHRFLAAGPLPGTSQTKLAAPSSAAAAAK